MPHHRFIDRRGADRIREGNVEPLEMSFVENVVHNAREPTLSLLPFRALIPPNLQCILIFPEQSAKLIVGELQQLSGLTLIKPRTLQRRPNQP